ncbi:MAG: DUF309 domain-containing protein [Myxococcales bacterium]|nr:DUF309 domain-containing protein [Myxococcales bacterium]
MAVRGDHDGESEGADSAPLQWPSYAFTPGGCHSGPCDEVRQPYPAGSALTLDSWHHNSAYTRGIAYFNAGFYWEAHEMWENVWLASKDVERAERAVRTLIKLAACGVKARQGMFGGVVKHLANARALVDVQCDDVNYGFSRTQLELIIERITDWAADICGEKGIASGGTLELDEGRLMPVALRPLQPV